VIKAIINWSHKYALERTRKCLLAMADMQLAEAGLSRELLQRGISEWPWGTESESNEVVKLDNVVARNSVEETANIVEVKTQIFGRKVRIVYESGCSKDRAA